MKDMAMLPMSRHVKQFFNKLFANHEGLFIVKLPVNKQKLQRLGDTKDNARRCFLNLERRLLKQLDVCSQYQNFMREYIELGHMAEVREDTANKTFCYLLIMLS